MRQRSNTSVWPMILLTSVSLILFSSPGCILFPEEGFQGEKDANYLPRASITGGVYEDGGATENRIHFYWTGSDPDGVISFFEWAIDDTVSEQSWQRTPDNDARISFSATTPVAPGDENEEITAFSDWHTFYVRSVDNQFARSRPDRRYFNSHTIAPTTRIVRPTMTTEVPRWATSIRMSWEGEDLDGSSADQQPVAYEIKQIRPGSIDVSKPERVRAAFRDSANILTGNLSRDDYPSDDVYEQARKTWTRVSGEVTSRWLLQMDPGAGKYAFGVRAIDEAGAVEPAFARGLNWVVFTVGNSPVKVRMREPTFGDFNFSATEWGDIWEVTAAPGQAIQFSWVGDASSSGTEPGPSNWAWDLADASNPDARSLTGMHGWIGWSMNNRATPIFFPPSTGEDQIHYFYLKMRDVSNNPATETKCIVKVTIAEFNFSKKFLIVDDLRVGPTPCYGNNPTDEMTDQWRLREVDGRYEGVLSQVGAYLSYNESPDYFSTFGYDREPNTVNVPENFLEILGQYETVLWDYGNGQDRNKVGLRWGSVNIRSIPQYIGMGGNMLIYGMFGPASTIMEIWEGETQPQCPEPFAPSNAWNNSSFLWQQLHLRGCIDKAHSTGDLARSLVGARSENPLYPDMAIDPERWSCGSNYRGIMRYEYLAPEFEESEAIPWYDLEEGMDILYRTRIGVEGVWQDDKPAVYRTFMTREDSLAGLQRGRVVCFGFHPYYFYEDDVRDAMSLAIDWLVTGSEYSGISK